MSNVKEVPFNVRMNQVTESYSLFNQDCSMYYLSNLSHFWQIWEVDSISANYSYNPKWKYYCKLQQEVVLGNLDKDVSIIFVRVSK